MQGHSHHRGSTMQPPSSPSIGSFSIEDGNGNDNDNATNKEFNWSSEEKKARCTCDAHL